MYTRAHANTHTHTHTRPKTQARGWGLQKLAWWPWEERTMPPHHLTQNLFSQLSVRQHSRYLSPFVQPQPSMWLSAPCWGAQAAWTDAADVIQRTVRFWSGVYVKTRPLTRLSRGGEGLRVHSEKCLVESDSKQWPLCLRHLPLCLSASCLVGIVGASSGWWQRNSHI